ncbi:MAG: helix-turn-helix domain-containing protein [Bdellovibrionia bacterium]
MSFEDTPTHYDVLDITPDASSQEIREAYVRIKSMYTRDSLVLYSLVSPEEREETLRKIETAYLTLSDWEKRKEYDLNLGIIGVLETPFSSPNTPPQINNIVSIDRSAPMDLEQEPSLEAETTDFQDEPPKTAREPNLNSLAERPKTEKLNTPIHPFTSHLKSSSENYTNNFTYHLTQRAQEKEKSRSSNPDFSNRSSLPQLSPELMQEIEMESEWKGSFLKKIREAYQISIEELSNSTKITKNYILAIEGDQYSKLPATVYVRGFVTQIAKTLKLFPDRVVPPYMARLKSEIEKLKN